MRCRLDLTLESAGVNRAEAEERYRDTAVKRVRGDFILKKIAELEEIKVLDEDINNGFARIAKQYNMTVPEVQGYFKSRDDMLPFIGELLNEKILKFLRGESKYIKFAADQNVEPAEDKTDKAVDDSENQKKSGE